MYRTLWTNYITSGIFQKKTWIHSLRLNADVAARARLILGSLVVGVKTILWVVLLVLYATFMELKKRNEEEKMSKINYLNLSRPLVGPSKTLRQEPLLSVFL